MKNLLEKIFPKHNIKNIALFYVMTAMNNAWFIESNWFYFWTRFMTAGQLGILDASVFGYGILSEIPSGAIADMLGKRKTILFALILAGVGGIMMGFAQNFWHLAIAFVIAQTGWSFYSGAGEAFAYDSLAEKKEEENYDRVITASSAVGRVATIITVLLGGVMYTLNFRSTHIAWGVAALIGAIAAYFTVEPAIDTIKFSLKGYFSTIKDGVSGLIQPNLRMFVVIIIVLMGADFMFNWGMIKPAVGAMFGYSAEKLAVIFSAFTLVNAWSATLIPWMRTKFSDKQGLFLLAGFMGVGFIGCGLSLGSLGFLPMLIISMSGSLAHPWMSIVVNQEIDSKYRATALSTVALLVKIPYVFSAMIAGRMIDSNLLNVFMVTIGIIIILSIVITYFINKTFKRNLAVVSAG
ncbi:MAG: MFS transporter [bacterium]|nr:MFS transporter [bacterium]